MNLEVVVKDRLAQNNPGAAGVLTQLYDTDPAIFGSSVIDAILTLSAKQEYTMLDLMLFRPILMLPIFRQYVTESTSSDEWLVMNRMLRMYLSAIAKDKGRPAGLVCSRILTLLRGVTKFNSGSQSISAARVTFVSSYKGGSADADLITSRIDIDNILQTQLSHAVVCAPAEIVSLEPIPIQVKLEGAFLTDLLTAMIQYHDNIMKTSAAFGYKVSPYIKNITLANSAGDST